MDLFVSFRFVSFAPIAAVFMEPEWTEAMDLPEGLEEQCAPRARPALRTRAHSRSG